MSSALRRSYEASIDIIKRHSSSFYTAFKNLPEEKFLAVASLYAFCRVCDDLVDESLEKSVAELSLNHLESNIRAFYQGETYSMPYDWWDAFRTTVEKYQIDLEPFLMQIQGQRRDLVHVDPETLEDLLEYSRLVAGSVGLMLAKVLAKSEEKGRDQYFLKACLDLGIGMQITNILRDVGEDLVERNRIYLPKTLMEKHGIDRKILLELIENQGKDLPHNFRMLWEELAALSKVYCDAINSQLCNFDPQVRVSIYAASIIYQEILKEVRKNHYNCLTQRNYTNKSTRFRLLNTARKRVNEVCYEE